MQFQIYDNRYYVNCTLFIILIFLNQVNKMYRNIANILLMNKSKYS